MPHPIFFGAQFAGTQFADKSVRGPICLKSKWKYQLSPNRHSIRFCTMRDIRRQGLHEIDDDLVFCSLIIPRNDRNFDVSSIQYCGYWWREYESIIIFSEKPSKNPTTSVEPVYNSQTSGKSWSTIALNKALRCNTNRTLRSTSRRAVAQFYRAQVQIKSGTNKHKPGETESILALNTLLCGFHCLNCPYSSLVKWHNTSAITSKWWKLLCFCFFCYCC